MADAGNMEVPEFSSPAPCIARTFLRFCLKWFKIGVFLRQNIEIFEQNKRDFEIFSNTFVIFRRFFENFRKNILAILLDICGKASPKRPRRQAYQLSQGIWSWFIEHFFCVCAVSLYVTEIHLEPQSRTMKPIILFGTVPCGFVGQPFSKQLQSHMQMSQNVNNDVNMNLPYGPRPFHRYQISSKYQVKSPKGISWNSSFHLKYLEKPP